MTESIDKSALLTRAGRTGSNDEMFKRVKEQEGKHKRTQCRTNQLGLQNGKTSTPPRCVDRGKHNSMQDRGNYYKIQGGAFLICSFKKKKHVGQLDLGSIAQMLGGRGWG